MAATEEKVKDIIAKELGVEREKLTNEASFMEDLGADSLDTVELVMAFEKEFDIDIPDEEAEKLRTVGDALNYLNQQDRREVMKRRVVVTGLGAVTPVGNDVATTWQRTGRRQVRGRADHEIRRDHARGAGSPAR